MIRFALWLEGAALAVLAVALLVIGPLAASGDDETGRLELDEVDPQVKEILGPELTATVALAEMVTVYKVGPAAADDPELGIPGHGIERRKELDAKEALRVKRALLDRATIVSSLDQPPATPPTCELVLRFRRGTEVATAAVAFADDAAGGSRLRFIERDRSFAVRRGALSEILRSTFPKP